MTRLLPVLALLSVVAVGCSFGGDGAEASRSDRCVDRFMQRVEPGRDDDEQRPVIERYVRVTYCDRFAREGWVYEDGTLSIDAQRWLVDGVACSAGDGETGDGETLRGEECQRLAAEGGDPTIDCALLHHVRKGEVQAYLRDLQRRRPVECDDGTPLDELGAG